MFKTKQSTIVSFLDIIFLIKIVIRRYVRQRLTMDVPCTSSLATSYKIDTHHDCMTKGIAGHLPYIIAGCYDISGVWVDNNSTYGKLDQEEKEEKEDGE